MKVSCSLRFNLFLLLNFYYQAMDEEENEENGDGRSKGKGARVKKRRKEEEEEEDPKPKKRGRPAREKPNPKNKRLIRQQKRLMEIVVKYVDRYFLFYLEEIYIFLT